MTRPERLDNIMTRSSIEAGPQLRGVPRFAHQSRKRRPSSVRDFQGRPNTSRGRPSRTQTIEQGSRIPLAEAWPPIANGCPRPLEEPRKSRSPRVQSVSTCAASELERSFREHPKKSATANVCKRVQCHTGVHPPARPLRNDRPRARTNRVQREAVAARARSPSSSAVSKVWGPSLAQSASRTRKDRIPSGRVMSLRRGP